MSDLPILVAVGALAVTSACISYVATKLLCRWAHNKRVLLDYPNHRSSHHVVTVRGGGIIFVLLALMSWITASYFLDISYGFVLAIAAAIVAAVGLLDDVKRIGIFPRLLAQFSAACIFLSAIPEPVFFSEIGGALGGPLWYCLAAFFIVSVTNIYNFMDGADGLAALHSAVLLIGWSLLTVRTDDGLISFAISLAVLAPLLGFLKLNWNPARIFMGDVGSTFLGFTFAALAVVQFPGLLRSSTFSTVILLMLPFLFDASFTILQRMFNGEQWYLAHQDHLFQRLLSKGYTHRQVAIIYALMSVFLGSIGLVTERFMLAEELATALTCTPLALLYIGASMNLPQIRKLTNLADRVTRETIPAGFTESLIYEEAHKINPNAGFKRNLETHELS